MSDERRCPACGAILGADAPLGLCVRCLLEIGVSGSDASEPPAVRPSAGKQGDRIGPYVLLQQLGEGGMGTVWMAEQTEPIRRMVALKIIKAGMDSAQVLARFEAERQALALMDHPNIAKIFDAGTTAEGRPYFVMELVKGISLTKFCDERKLSIRERLELFVQVCQAIQHAHQKGIIHRDISPSNVLVALYDGTPVPKVIDFGIAKATGLRLTERMLFTEFGVLIGKPEYMSPEQAELNQLDIDTRSDIYSLGVLLYELLTGTTPLTREALHQAAFDEVLRRIREEEPPKPSTRLSQSSESLATISAQRKLDPAHLTKLVRGDLDWIVMKALEKDRARRYDTAVGFATDLERYLNEEAVLARPPSNLYRFRKMVRRNKVIFSAAGAVVAVLVLGVVASTWQAVRATKAEQEQSRLLYIANMKLAQEVWERNHLTRLGQLLKETKDSPARGFEWYYWQRQLHLDVLTLRGHSGRVTSVAVSRDGERIITGSDDKTAKVWDMPTGQVLFNLTGHTEAITCVFISADGQLIITGSHDGTARLWEASSGRFLRVLAGHRDGILSVAISPDGQWIVTGSADNTAKVWMTASGEEIITLKGHTQVIKSVAFSPDGKRIVTGGYDGTTRVWNARTGSPINVLGHDRCESAAFSQDGELFITAHSNGGIRMWDRLDDNLWRELLAFRADKDAVNSVAFSPGGQRFASGGVDSILKIRETSSGRELLSFKGHTGGISSVAFFQDGQRVVTGSADGTAKVWEISPDRHVLTLKGHTNSVSSVAFFPDGRQIVTGSHDETVKLWDASTGRELTTFKGHYARITSVVVSSDGHRVLTGSFDSTAKLWEASSGRELLTVKGHWRPVGSVAFSPNGRRILTGSWDSTARVWDAFDGRELLTLRHPQPTAGTTNADTVAIGSGRTANALNWSPIPVPRTNVVGAESVSSPRIEPPSPPRGLHADVSVVLENPRGIDMGVVANGVLFVLFDERPVAYSPDGKRICTSSGFGAVSMWDAVSGRPLFTLRRQVGCTHLAFSPDGHRIVTVDMDGQAKVLEAATGRVLLLLKGPSAGSACFSPDGQRVVTAAGTAVTVWDAVTGREMLTIEGHSGRITSLAFSPDGQRIVTGSWDNTAKVWQTASPDQVATWQKEEQDAAQRLTTLEQERNTAEESRTAER